MKSYNIINFFFRNNQADPIYALGPATASYTKLLEETAYRVGESEELAHVKTNIILD